MRFCVIGDLPAEAAKEFMITLESILNALEEEIGAVRIQLPLETDLVQVP